jgi:hypothetical protein
MPGPCRHILAHAQAAAPAQWRPLLLSPIANGLPSSGAARAALLLQHRQWAAAAAGAPLVSDARAALGADHGDDNDGDGDGEDEGEDGGYMRPTQAVLHRVRDAVATAATAIGSTEAAAPGGRLSPRSQSPRAQSPRSRSPPQITLSPGQSPATQGRALLQPVSAAEPAAPPPLPPLLPPAVSRADSLGLDMASLELPSFAPPPPPEDTAAMVPAARRWELLSQGKSAHSRTEDTDVATAAVAQQQPAQQRHTDFLRANAAKLSYAVQIERATASAAAVADAKRSARARPAPRAAAAALAEGGWANGLGLDMAAFKSEPGSRGPSQSDADAATGAATAAAAAAATSAAFAYYRDRARTVAAARSSPASHRAVRGPHAAVAAVTVGAVAAGIEIGSSVGGDPSAGRAAVTHEFSPHDYRFYRQVTHMRMQHQSK